MGVQNLWQLIESTARPVNMNKGLEGKILAIDISIWLHQAAKGMRDRQNPHILLLLHRICKLLHFKIKPIFVFDGGVPELKRRTLAERKQRRELAANKVKEANQKIRTNYLKMLAIQQLKGEQIQPMPPPPMDESEKDLFELPETHLRAQLVVDDEKEDDDDDDEEEEITENTELEPVRKATRTTWSKKSDYSNYQLPDMSQIDDDALSNLPLEMQHDILSEIKERLKRGGQQKIDHLPKKSDDFSDYQVQKLLKQNIVSKKISNLNRTIKRQKFDIPLDGNSRVFAGKLASDASTQYILIKSDKTPSNPRTVSTTSTPSPMFIRHTTNDFSADDLMNRDPTEGLTQRSSLKRIDDEERRDLELAIQKSLEDQKPSPIQAETNVTTTIVDSESSDSDDGDFIDIPTKPKLTEPEILAPFISEPAENPINTSAESNEVNPMEEDSDETSPNSSAAIEDIQAFINENEDLPHPSDTQMTVPSVSQLEAFDEIQSDLVNDTAAQVNAARGNERLTTTLNDTMHEDTQYLLRLFGIPFLVSPSEAEAQCAYLNLTNQCDGVITDDSDVWLFGASRVYRHFFRQNQLVEYYDATLIANQLGIDREMLIAIGMIVGSDYTKGINNAGLMTALEILQEFHGTCMERLEKFRHWWSKAQRADYKTQSKVLKRLRNLELFEGFPNNTVYDAYINPKVNQDQSKFTWAMPQLELIREFIAGKLKWDRRKIDEMILPVIKRYNSTEMQSRIDSFFAPVPFEGTSMQMRRNTRLKAAIDLLKQRSEEAKNDPNPLDLSEDDEEMPLQEKEKAVKKKRQRTKKTTKLMSNVLNMAVENKRSTKRKSPVLSDDETFSHL